MQHTGRCQPCQPGTGQPEYGHGCTAATIQRGVGRIKQRHGVAKIKRKSATVYRGWPERSGNPAAEASFRLRSFHLGECGWRGRIAAFALERKGGLAVPGHAGQDLHGMAARSGGCRQGRPERRTVTAGGCLPAPCRGRGRRRDQHVRKVSRNLLTIFTQGA